MHSAYSVIKSNNMFWASNISKKEAVIIIIIITTNASYQLLAFKFLILLTWPIFVSYIDKLQAVSLFS